MLYALAANQSSLGDRCGVVGGGTGGYLGTIDTATGTYTMIGRDDQFGSNAGGIAFAPDGTLYFTGAWTTDDLLYTLDPTTAEVLSSTALTPGGNYFGLSWHPTENRLYGTFDAGSVPVLATIEPDSGAVTEVGSTDFGYLGIAFARAAARNSLIFVEPHRSCRTLRADMILVVQTFATLELKSREKEA